MKYPALFMAVLVLTASAAPAQTSTWVPDKAQSRVDYKISHLLVSSENGHFANIGGAVQIDGADITKSTVDVTIDTRTIAAGMSAENDVLKEPVFFDVAQYPNASFKSTAIGRVPGGFTIQGNLTLRGVTKPVTLQATQTNAPAMGPDRKLHATYRATTTISRSAFDIGNGYPTSVIGDDAKLIITLNLVKQ